jgi:hypothetical protein
MSAADSRPVVCVDLDGVLNLFDTWREPEFFHPPRPGAREFLARLNEAGFRVVVFTVRWFEWVEKWLEENGLRSYVDSVTDRKIAAAVYLDDRAVCFRGDFDDAYRRIVTFQPFWERGASQ